MRRENARFPSGGRLSRHTIGPAAVEVVLDGLYIIRTSVTPECFDAASCEHHYQSLAKVERALRSMKTVDLKVSSIHDRLSDRVCTHVDLGMLAFSVEWHLREAWRELHFTDSDQAGLAERFAGAQTKTARRYHADGTRILSFPTRLTEFATIVRNTGYTSAAENVSTLTVTTKRKPLATARRSSLRPGLEGRPQRIFWTLTTVSVF